MTNAGEIVWNKVCWRKARLTAATVVLALPPDSRGYANAEQERLVEEGEVILGSSGEEVRVTEDGTYSVCR